MFSARGIGGEVFVGTKVAYVLGRWTLEQGTVLGHLSSTVRADVARCDAFWSTQRPFVLALGFGHVRWIWTEVDCLSADPLVLRIVGDPTIKE